jgi:lysyl-tRNA synthetase class 2
MVFVEDLMRRLVRVTAGESLAVVYEGDTIDFGKPFRSVSYFELMKEYAGISGPDMTEADVRSRAQSLGVTFDPGASNEALFDLIFKKVVRSKIIQPTFVTRYPAHLLPLSKATADDPLLADAFQLVVGGMELVKAFSELNDPQVQRERFARQESDRAKGDAEAQRFDEEFLEALEHGMPPAGGVGIGIDRLVMVLTGTKNIREVILFPTLRPKG